jgi:pimeloyl-ACP methyl ester carboxylesterase
MIQRKFLSVGLLVAAPFLLFAATRASATLASRVLENRYPPPGQMVSVGDHKLHLYCMGAGQPTVIIEPGMGQDWVGWRRVIPKLVEFNRVCVYDRAGYGWSEAGPWPRTALQSVGELHVLLTKAAVPGPYILAAHSFGGYIARIYASQFRSSLSGVVLVDPSHEDERPMHPADNAHRINVREILSMVPPLGTERLKRLYRGQHSLPSDLRDLPTGFQSRYLIASSLLQLKSERNEFDSLAESEAQARASPFPPALPLTVITAMPLPSEATLTLHLELQRKLAQSSLFGRQILAENSRHMVPVEQPGLIVDAIRSLATSSRITNQLQPRMDIRLPSY